MSESDNPTPADLGAMLKIRSRFLVGSTEARRLVDMGWAEVHPSRPGLVRLTTAGETELERGTA